MTITDHRTDEAAAAARVDIWRCEGCQRFHVRAGEVLLTFTPDEFESFLRAAGRCYLGDNCAHFTSGHEAGKVSEATSDPAEEFRNVPLLASALEH